MVKSDICFHLKVTLNTATFFNVTIQGNYRGLSSPDLKALVGYSNILITFCPASVSLSVRPSVCLSVYFLQLHHLIDIKQTSKKVSLVKEIQVC